MTIVRSSFGRPRFHPRRRRLAQQIFFAHGRTGAVAHGRTVSATLPTQQIGALCRTQYGCMKDTGLRELLCYTKHTDNYGRARAGLRVIYSSFPCFSFAIVSCACLSPKSFPDSVFSEPPSLVASASYMPAIIVRAAAKRRWGP